MTGQTLGKPGLNCDLWPNKRIAKGRLAPATSEGTTLWTD